MFVDTESVGSRTYTDAVSCIVSYIIICVNSIIYFVGYADFVYSI